MNLESIRNNKVGMILQFSIPSIIAMVLTSLINVTDGFFTGNYVGKEAIAAVNLGLPIVYLYLGLGLMLSVGGSVIAGIALGANEKEKCVSVFNQTIVTAAIATVIVSIIVGICMKPILTLVGAEGIVGDYFASYYYIMLLELPLMVLNNSFGMFIRGEGNPQFFMMTSILNVVLNFVLDYLFAGCFNMGISGIAVASLISTGICSVVLMGFFVKQSKIYKFKRFQFDKEVFRSTVLNGFSEFIGEMSMCITMFAYNYVIMKKVGVDGVTAFTIVGYVAYVFGMILTGFGQGATPLVSFSFGAKDYSLTMGLRKRTNGFVFGAGVIVMLLMILCADWYSGIFVKDEMIQDTVKSGVYIFVISFLFSGVNTITSFFFTSIGKAKESAIISSMRGLVVLLICIIVLPILFGMNGIWMVAPVTELMTILISGYFISVNDSKMKRQEI